jgi:hypothetical protein
MFSMVKNREFNATNLKNNHVSSSLAVKNLKKENIISKNDSSKLKSFLYLMRRPFIYSFFISLFLLIILFLKTLIDDNNKALNAAMQQTSEIIKKLERNSKNLKEIQEVISVQPFKPNTEPLHQTSFAPHKSIPIKELHNSERMNASLDQQLVDEHKYLHNSQPEHAFLEKQEDSNKYSHNSQPVDTLAIQSGKNSNINRKCLESLKTTNKLLKLRASEIEALIRKSGPIQINELKNEKQRIFRLSYEIHNMYNILQNQNDEPVLQQMNVLEKHVLQLKENLSAYIALKKDLIEIAPENIVPLEGMIQKIIKNNVIFPSYECTDSLYTYLEYFHKMEMNNIEKFPEAMNLGFWGEPGRGKTRVVELISIMADACIFIKNENWQNDPEGSFKKIVKYIKDKNPNFKKVLFCFDDQCFSQAQVAAIKSLINQTNILYKDEITVMLALCSNEDISQIDPGLADRFYKHIKLGAQLHYQSHLSLQITNLAIFIQKNYSKCDLKSVINNIILGISYYFADSKKSINADYLNYRNLFGIFEVIKSHMEEILDQKNSSKAIKKLVHQIFSDGSIDVRKNKKQGEVIIDKLAEISESIKFSPVGRNSRVSSAMEISQESTIVNKSGATIYTFSMEKHFYEAMLIYINMIIKINLINEFSGNDLEKLIEYYKTQIFNIKALFAACTMACTLDGLSKNSYYAKHYNSELLKEYF